jgi:hypothetical protein
MAMGPDWLREFKKECLLDEHRSLSSFVEKEIVMTTVTKLVTVGTWLLAAGGRPVAVALVAILVLWSVDVLYAYYGDVYKRRRLTVRAWLDALPNATETELTSWKSPANPFDGLSRGDKIGAMRGTITSPAVSGVYVALLLATVAIAAL